jgi:aminoglycoside 3-N-acetyltransferase
MLLVHSDLRGFDLSPIAESSSSGEYRKIVTEFIFDKIDKIAENLPVYLPAFNYDFTKTKTFNVLMDLPQVGALPVAAMSREEWSRSKAPVFSFLAKGEHPTTYNQPFSEHSLFSELVERKGKIHLLGVGFDSFTFIHHVEHVVKSPYRYKKQFNGNIICDGEESMASVEFHVRPKGLNLDYDFNKLEALLLKNFGALKVTSTNIQVDASAAFQIISDKLDEEPLFLLDRKSANVVRDKLDIIQRPFELEDFE